MLKIKLIVLLLVTQFVFISPKSFLNGAGFKDLVKNPFKKSQHSDDDFDFKTKEKAKFIGEFCSIAGLNLITLQGVSLVTGLDGTGGDPPPSPFRTRLLDEMRRQEISNPNQILASPDTAMVIIQAYLPPLVRKGDKFDVDVRIARGDKTSSLNGGWLMKCMLSEYANIEGRMRKGHKYAYAEGPVLVSVGQEDEDRNQSIASILRRGKVLAGGSSLKSRDMSIIIKYKYQNIRNSKIISNKIGARFYGYSKAGARIPLAEAKRDDLIELKIHKNYKDNYARYNQVIRSIPFRETDIGRHVRMKRLENELHKPQTCAKAAVYLEAIGDEGIPILLSGLKNENLEVQVQSALALAYMNREEGIPILAKAAKEESAFRVYALAAMSASKGADSYVKLVELLNEESAETRYGAFRALTTMNENEPFIRGELMNDEFKLHVLKTSGPPMVHLTNHKKAEVVLFGADQKFSSPLVLRAGAYIRVTSQPGSDEVVVSRYQPGKKGERKVVSLNVSEVIHTVTDMGASYPDVAKMLFQASVQENLHSRVEIDALPKAGRAYSRTIAGKPNKTKTRIGNNRMVPDLFFNGKPKKKAQAKISNVKNDSAGTDTEMKKEEKGFLKKIQLINYFKKEK